MGKKLKYGGWVSVVPYTKGDYLKKYLLYEILIIFLISSYFIFMFANVGGAPEETVKLCVTYFVLTFVFALILLIVMYVLYIVFELVGVVDYVAKVFIIVAAFIIICLMILGSPFAAFSWPMVAAGVIGVLIITFAYRSFVLFISIGPFFISIAAIINTFRNIFTADTFIYDLSPLVAIVASLVIYLYIFRAISILTEKYTGDSSGGIEFWSPSYLSFLGGFYSSLFVANLVYTVTNVLSFDIINLSNLSLPMICSSILFGLLFSSIFCYVIYRKNRR